MIHLPHAFTLDRPLQKVGRFGQLQRLVQVAQRRFGQSSGTKDSGQVRAGAVPLGQPDHEPFDSVALDMRRWWREQ